MTETSRRPTGPADSPGFLLWRATHRWQRAIGAALAPLELTHVQFVLLAGVWWLAGQGQRLAPPTQRELAEHAGTDPMMTSQVVRALEVRGLLVRARSPTDGRARSLTPTRAGTRLAERAIAIVEAVDGEFFARADPGELRRALGALDAAPARSPDA